MTHVDVLPMLLSLAAVSVPEGLPGRDPLAARPDSPWAVVVNCSTYPRRYAGVRDGRWKYLRDVSGEADWTAPSDDVAEELYDLGDDRAEATNLATVLPDRVGEMRA